jgi:hypothetical protein
MSQSTITWAASNTAYDYTKRYWQIDLAKTEYLSSIVLMFPVSATPYRFFAAFSNDTFESEDTTSFLYSSSSHSKDYLKIGVGSGSTADTNYIEFTATASGAKVDLFYQNVTANKARFLANSIRIYPAAAASGTSMSISEIRPTIQSLADDFVGQRLILSDGITITTNNTGSDVLQINSDGVRSWSGSSSAVNYTTLNALGLTQYNTNFTGTASTTTSKIGYLGTSSGNPVYGAWFPTIAIGGTTFDAAPFQADANGNISMTTANTTVEGSGTSGIFTLKNGSGTVTFQCLPNVDTFRITGSFDAVGASSSVYDIGTDVLQRSGFMRILGVDAGSYGGGVMLSGCRNNLTASAPGTIVIQQHETDYLGMGRIDYPLLTFNSAGSATFAVPVTISGAAVCSSTLVAKGAFTASSTTALQGTTTISGAITASSTLTLGTPKASATLTVDADANTYGIWASNTSTGGFGIYAISYAGYGLYGRASNTTYPGIRAYNAVGTALTAETAGAGQSGLYGYSSNGYGVYGHATNTTYYAIYGVNGAGTGIFGRATATGYYGVYGLNYAGYGVYGYASNASYSAIRGDNPVGYGVVGYSSSSGGFGLSGYNTAGYAATFRGYSVVSGRINPDSGTIRLGGTDAYHGRIDYNAASTTAFTFDNTYDNAGAATQFRMRTAGTPIEAMTILGTGQVKLSSSLLFSNLVPSVQFTGGTIYDPSSYVYTNTASIYYPANAGNGDGTKIATCGNISIKAQTLEWGGPTYVHGAEIFLYGGISPYAGQTAGPIDFRTANTSRMVIQGSGYVGIGTSAPATTLHVAGSATISGANSLWLLDEVGIPMRTTSASSNGLNINTNSTGDIILTTRNSTNAERIRVLGASGNVGIGTSTPTCLMHLSGNNVPARGQLSIASTDYSQISFYYGSTTTTNLGSQVYRNTTSANGDFQINNFGTGAIIFGTNNTARAQFTGSGHFVPAVTTTYNLGSSSSYWKTLYATSATISEINTTNFITQGKFIPGTSTVNSYAHVARLSIVSQYGYAHGTLFVSNVADGSGRHEKSQIDVTIKQQTVMTNVLDYCYITSKGTIPIQRIYAVVTTDNASSKIVDVYVMRADGYQYTFTTAINCYGCEIQGNQTLLAALPAGTQYVPTVNIGYTTHTSAQSAYYYSGIALAGYSSASTSYSGSDYSSGGCGVYGYNSLGVGIFAKSLATGHAALSAYAPSGYGVYGAGSSTSYAGVHGYNAAGNAVMGYTGATGYSGVRGSSSGNSHGVLGYASNSSYYGVYGSNGAVGGSGVYGSSLNGYGVYGYTDNASYAGVYGYSTRAGAYAVRGNNSAGYGVLGVSQSTSYYGVYGYNTAGNGTYGYSLGTGYAGVRGSSSGNSHGVYGYASNSSYYGVYGYNGAGHGVYGKSSGSGYSGVYGTSDAGHGVYGKATTTGYSAVYGTNSLGTGVTGHTEASNYAGVYGYTTNASGYSGYFAGGKFYISLGASTTGALVITGLPATSTTLSMQTLLVDTTNGNMFRYTSSARYKQNVKTIDIDERYWSLRPVYYDSLGCVNQNNIGMIAEEVFNYYPSIVSLDNKGRPDGVMYSQFGVLAVAATQLLKKVTDSQAITLTQHEQEIQELRAKHEAELADVKSEIAELRAILKSIQEAA